MRVTQHEYATLIRESDREHPLLCAFGPHGVTLEARPENQWAVDRVKALRATPEGAAWQYREHLRAAWRLYFEGNTAETQQMLQALLSPEAHRDRYPELAEAYHNVDPACCSWVHQDIERAAHYLAQGDERGFNAGLSEAFEMLAKELDPAGSEELEPMPLAPRPAP